MSGEIWDELDADTFDWSKVKEVADELDKDNPELND